ncbi:choline/ethanolamine kinase family protein [Roseibium salinum]|nr:choline/ethanolamine kinase family protein [Roseibium salinum]
MPIRIREAFRDHPDLRAICGPPRHAVPQAGLTNQVYRLEAGNGDYYLRLPRAQTADSIDRQAEARNLALAAALGLALPPVYIDRETGILVTRAVEVLAETPADLPQQLGTLLGRLHSSGAAFAGELHADKVFRAEREGLDQLYRDEIDLLEQVFRWSASGANSGSAERLVPSHGDLSPGNCLAVPGGIRLIDWEYSAMAEPAWDLAYAVLEHGFSKAQERAFLGAYRRATPAAASLCPPA